MTELGEQASADIQRRRARAAKRLMVGSMVDIPEVGVDTRTLTDGCAGDGLGGKTNC